MQTDLTLADFDFVLPPELIAQHPAPERSAARLLDGRAVLPQDYGVSALPQLLRAGDLLVFNDTAVIKARLYGSKPTGARLELLVERVLDNNEVVAQLRVSKKPAVGTRLLLDGGCSATVLGRWPDAAGSLFHLRLDDDPWRFMQAHGHVPLPPYIQHGDQAEDEARYQTVFARVPGAVAAPTAALHFDAGLLQALQQQGVHTAHLTLHVGAGTFAPVRVDNIAEHQMHSERYQVPATTVQALADCSARGGRVVAVGTTSARALESWALMSNQTASQPRAADASGFYETQIFITPGFNFSVVDLLITNFHLPKSTLLMLVSAFAGHQHILHLYQHAVRERYRFFSYGDAMLLARADSTGSANGATNIGAK